MAAQLLVLILLSLRYAPSLQFTPPTTYRSHAVSLLLRQAEASDDGDSARQLLLDELEAEKLKLRAATLRLEAERAELELERAAISATANTATATVSSSPSSSSSSSSLSLPQPSSLPSPPLPRDESVLPLTLRFGRSAGSWMPQGWGESGETLEICIDMKLSLAPCRTSTEGVVGGGEDTKACSPMNPRARVVMAEGEGDRGTSGGDALVGRGRGGEVRRLADTSVVVGPNGGWVLEKGILKLFLDLATAAGEEPLKNAAGDVDVPSGRLIAQLRCWTEQELAEYGAAADAAVAATEAAAAAYDGISGGNPNQKVTMLERRNRAMNSEARARAKLPPDWLPKNQRRVRQLVGGEGGGGAAGEGCATVAWMGGSMMAFSPEGVMSTKQPGRLFGLGTEYRSCGQVSVVP